MSSSFTVKGVAISFVDFIIDNVVTSTSTVLRVAINELCNENVKIEEKYFYKISSFFNNTK